MLAQLIAEPGVSERVFLSGRVGFMALHGGLEAMTAEIATAAADAAGASLYSVTQPDDFHWHIPSQRYDPAASERLRSFCAHVDVAISLHGYGGLRSADARWTTALLGGGNRELARELGTRLRAALPAYTWLDDLDAMPPNLRGVHPDNPVNRVRDGGVQVEMPPRVRGIGPHWDGVRAQRAARGEGAETRGAFLPHTVALVAVLARLAADVMTGDTNAQRVVPAPSSGSVAAASVAAPTSARAASGN